MKIERLTIENFGPFKGRSEIVFPSEAARGTTIVIGGNGSGKTSLVSAAIWCLFGAKPLEGVVPLNCLCHQSNFCEGGASATGLETSVEISIAAEGESLSVRRVLGPLKADNPTGRVAVLDAPHPIADGDQNHQKYIDQQIDRQRFAEGIFNDDFSVRSFLDTRNVQENAFWARTIKTMLGGNVFEGYPEIDSDLLEELGPVADLIQSRPRMKQAQEGGLPAGVKALIAVAVRIIKEISLHNAGGVSGIRGTYPLILDGPSGCLDVPSWNALARCVGRISCQKILLFTPSLASSFDLGLIEDLVSVYEIENDSSGSRIRPMEHAIQ
jgi:hypothetical protein